ncbi:choice-of-anchor I domain-containing protein [Novosphingobium marinum]|uniref:2',3'-cyclic-nucleotide 2'-phosphodiesterase (5'-nucleotidase family) n=1 Tax=Novosphingobium marinum TaxID=1514948 RepID=A0A7Y9Y0Q9_9SPHN|nr:Ig-like domain-containing protein [Novosphingobium marinum]NYH96848.1 2',3'-cyclic-nucleotide 2'-phosphodiesterase (5'-nucleotidase family) [Novosphingobium marinum]
MAILIRIVSADGKHQISKVVKSLPARLAVPEGAKVEAIDQETGREIEIAREQVLELAGEGRDSEAARDARGEAGLIVEEGADWAQTEANLSDLAGEGESLEGGLATAAFAEAGAEAATYSYGLQSGDDYGDDGGLFGGSNALLFGLLGAAAIAVAVVLITDDDDDEDDIDGGDGGGDGGGDTDAPDAPAGLDLAAGDDTGASDSDNVTSITNGLTFTGTAEAGSTVELFDGGASLGTTTAGDDGSFTIDVDLAEGDHSLTATATDAAGNTSAASAALDVTVDATAGDAPAGLDLDTASDDGEFDDDDLVTDGQGLVIGGTAEPGTTVELFNGSNSLGTTTAGDDGVFSFTVNLPDGANDLTAVATDTAGNVTAASAPLTVTVDSSAPAAPVSLTLDPADDDGANDGVTDQTDGLTITGTAEAGSTVELFDGSTSLGTTTAGSDGSFSFDVDLDPGTRTITAIATDANGNVGAASAPLTLDIGSAPRLVNTTVDGDGTVVTLYFDEQLDMDSVPDASDFSVDMDGDIAVESVQVLGNRVVLNLESPVDGDATVSYDGDAITDAAGNATAAFADLALQQGVSVMASNAVGLGRTETIELNGAEISAFDPETNRIFVTGSDGVQVIQLDDNLGMTLLGEISVGTNNITSVAVSNGILAVAVVADDKTQPGDVYFISTSADVGEAAVLGSIEVGSLPDMVTFTPDGSKVLVANEAELDEDGNDPVGSISIIDISNGIGAATVETAGFEAFNDQIDALKAAGVRLFAGEEGFEDTTVAQDLEPEYIAVSPDGTTAMVTLQENNAVAIVDIATATVVSVQPLGLKSFDGLLADFSDRDGGIDIDAGALQDDMAMLDGQNGYFAKALFTVGETLDSGYTPPGVMDGIGATLIDENTVRVFVNHELAAGDGYAFELANGTELTGSRVSYFDIDKTTMEIVDGGLAFDTVYDSAGNVVTDNSFSINPGDAGTNGFDRFCSASLFEADTFGDGRGLADTIFFTGEETGGNFNAIGGVEWALDIDSGELWALPSFGHGAWENVTQLDTGTTTHVAFILSDDTSPFDADGDDEPEGAPLFLYVGEKDSDPEAGFLARNGLDDGQLFVWVPDDGDNDPSSFSGQGSSSAGEWVLVDNSRNEAMASDDGSTGFDQFGYPTQRNLWSQAEDLGAFAFSRPEDVATNPENPSEFVLASTGAPGAFDDADQVGEIYTMDVQFSIVPAPGLPGDPVTYDIGATGSLEILYDGDADPDQALRSPDNLEWSPDGFIYVQEDKAFDDVFEAGDRANTNEAGIVRIDPADGSVVRIANIDRSVLLPEGAVDEAPDVPGHWESSGILDVSALFDRPAGSLFIADVQAHGIDDQNRFDVEGDAARIVDGDLKEGGQLVFLFNEEATTDTFPTSGNAGVFGQFMPDAIASYTGADGMTYYVIANEGDDRDDFLPGFLDGFEESQRVDDLTLDPTAFPNADVLQQDDELGRLGVSQAPGNDGDLDGDGDIDRLLAYGGRSFSILDSNGNIVFDSGSQIEEFVAMGGLYDEDTNTGAFDDGRSDNKGPEPEGVTTGVFGDSVLAFIALERGGGGVMVYDVTDPTDVVFVQYLRGMDDISPEGLAYVSAADSPTGDAFLIVANEESETLSLFELTEPGTYTLQLLHFADAEAGLLASQTAPNLAALVDAFEDDYANTVILAGGDNFLPGPFLAAGADPSINDVLPDGDVQGRVDIAIHNAIGVQASTIGNHEFDLGSRGLRDVIGPDGDYAGTMFPYLSANLDFSGDGDLNRFFEETLGDDDLEFASDLDNAIVPSAVIEENGELIGLVGATTQVLARISSPSGTVVDGNPGDDDMELLAQQLQPYIDDLRDQGVDKIIVMAHLQQIENEIALAPLLEGVDIILAAGSNTRLGDADDEAVAFPGHEADFADTYPILTQGADGAPTLIVNTDNEYTYLGRLVVEFDENGEIVVDRLDDYSTVNGAYASTEANVADAWGTTVENLDATAFAEGTKGSEVLRLTDAVQDIIDAKSGNVFGFSTVYLEGARAIVRSEETNLGNLTADANADAAREALGLDDDVAVVAIKNGGGIRSQIGTVSGTGDDVVFGPNPDNEISQLDIENSLRFDNGLVVFEATPEQLLNLLNSPNAFNPGNGGFLQTSGIQVSYDPGADAGMRVVDVALVDANGNKTAIVDDGEVLDSAPDVINMVILDFTARQDGDGYQVAENGSNFRYILEDYSLSDPLGVIDNPDSDDPDNILVDTNSFDGEVLGEQEALADYLLENYGTLETAYDIEDTDQEFDERIQNIEVREDTVLDGVSAAMAAMSIEADAAAFVIG